MRVRGGKPVGGLKTIRAKKGERVRIRVSSHRHDRTRSTCTATTSTRTSQADRPARFAFEANAEGIFEIELHGTGTQIAKLVVEP